MKAKRIDLFDIEYEGKNYHFMFNKDADMAMSLLKDLGVKIAN